MISPEIDRNAWLSLYPEAVRFQHGLPAEPRTAICHPTNRCDHDCVGCEYASLHAVRADELEAVRMMQLMDEMADLGVRAVLFSGGGEPLLHDRLPEAIERLNARGLLVGLFTNGSRLAAVADLLVRCATFVRVSVDAARPESYAAVRGVPAAAFGRLIDQIRDLVHRRNTAGSSLEIGLKFLVRPETVQEIPEFFRMARSLGVDNLHFKALRGGADEPSLEQMRQAQCRIEAGRAEHPHLAVHGGMPDGRPHSTVPCWISPLRLVISAEGDVQICNYFHHRRATHTFGNIHRAALRQIWFGDAHRKALGSIRKEQCERFDCRFHKLNAKLAEVLEHHRASFDFI